MPFLRYLLFSTATACAVVSGPTVAQARQADATSVVGSVMSSDGVPLAGAAVRLRGSGPAHVAISDSKGQFKLDVLPPGTYTVEARATGYQALTGRTVQVRGDIVTTLALTLPKAQVGALTVIGNVSANGRQALSTAPSPTLAISTQPYAQQGVTRISDVLSNELSTTVYPVIGGGLNAPAVVALRGPDPSETLVDVDGHQVNNGSTGDFDLSLLDPADLQSAEIVYGIAPSSLFGPNTLGGALNVVTLEPTTKPHEMLRFNYGSYDTLGETFQATGTQNRLGYAVSLHRVTSGGQLVNEPYPTTDGTGTAPVGNAMDSTSTIGKLRYSFGNSGAFVGLSFHDQSVYRDLSATLSSVQTPENGAPGPGDAYENFSGSSMRSTNLSYGLDALTPIGRPNAQGIALTTAIFRHQSTLVNQSVFGPAIGTSPYLYNNRDLIGDDTLEIDHLVPHGSINLKAALTEENLTTDFIPGVVFADAVAHSSPTSRAALSMRRQPADAIPGIGDSSEEQLGQTQRWIGLIYHDDPTPKLHYSVGGYYSSYTTFGTSLDPRFGFVWTPTGDTSVRFSVGSTFQSPQLPTFIVPKVLPQPVDGYVSIGNANATAERATSYDLGYEHLFRLAMPLHAGLDLYRTDLHNGVATYYSPTQCQNGVDYGNDPPCLSYPVNVSREVYQGLELHGDLALQHHTTLRASYDIDSVYTQSYPATAADDTPLYEQSLGVPLHKMSLTFAHDTGSGLGYYVGGLYEGAYNELNLPPYATLRAGVTWHVRDLDLGLYGTNLTNVYNFRLTRLGAGVPYGGLTDVAATDAIPLPGPQITFGITYRH